MLRQQHLNRRHILRKTTSGLGLATIAAATTTGRAAKTPDERVTVGIVGLGSRGFNLIDELLKQNDAQIVSVCDVDAFHYRDRKWGQGTAYGRKPALRKIHEHYGHESVTQHNDYRELCQSDDIDVIVVATPDHWHALCTIEALRNGKDVYCEKPLTHTFREGQLVYREAANRNAIFQTGSQQRSDRRFRRAVELVRNHHLGKISRVEVGLPAGYSVPQGDTTVTPPPDGLDYDFWCGPALKLPYMRARHHRWWRGHRAFGGGVLMDWIGHHNDIAHWALDLDRSGPTYVEARNWKWPTTDVYDTPQSYEIVCKYKGEIENSISSRHQVGTRFIGDKGWLFVTRGKLEASKKHWLDPEFDPGPIRVYESNNHMRNFLDCVRSRQPCIAPAETAHRSITPGHLGYVSQQLGRGLAWDPENESVLDDPEAQRLLLHESYREPWTLDV